MFSITRRSSLIVVRVILVLDTDSLRLSFEPLLTFPDPPACSVLLLVLHLPVVVDLDGGPTPFFAYFLTQIGL